MRIVRCFLVIIPLLLSGCMSTVQVDRAVPQTTISDTSPARLNVVVGVTEGGYDASTAAMTEISIQFFFQGNLVRFQNDETLACNNAGATHLITGFDQMYPTVNVAGKAFSCTYTSGQYTTPLQFFIPSIPRILTPTQGASMIRSSATVIQFQGEEPISGIVASGRQDKAVAVITASGTATVDTSHFNAGQGSIALTQYPSITNVTASAFASFRANCTAIAQVNVTWT